MHIFSLWHIVLYTKTMKAVGNSFVSMVSCRVVNSIILKESECASMQKHTENIFSRNFLEKLYLLETYRKPA